MLISPYSIIGQSFLCLRFALKLKNYQTIPYKTPHGRPKADHLAEAYEFGLVQLDFGAKPNQSPQGLFPQHTPGIFAHRVHGDQPEGKRGLRQNHSSSGAATLRRARGDEGGELGPGRVPTSPTRVVPGDRVPSVGQRKHPRTNTCNFHRGGTKQLNPPPVGGRSGLCSSPPAHPSFPEPSRL